MAQASQPVHRRRGVEDVTLALDRARMLAGGLRANTGAGAGAPQGVVDLPQVDVEAIVAPTAVVAGLAQAWAGHGWSQATRLALTRFGRMFPVGTEDRIPGPGPEEVFLVPQLSRRQ